MVGQECRSIGRRCELGCCGCTSALITICCSNGLRPVHGPLSKRLGIHEHKFWTLDCLRHDSIDTLGLHLSSLGSQCGLMLLRLESFVFSDLDGKACKLASILVLSGE